jgi:beta-lactamase regulating signal transducer with metallopeptidase domain
MFQLHVWSAPQLPWLLYLVNIAVASLLVCGLALLVQRAWPRRTLPLRHTILLTGLLVTLAAPAIVGLIAAAGFSLLEITTQDEASPVASANSAPSLNAEMSLQQPAVWTMDPDAMAAERQPEQGGPLQLPASPATSGSADDAIERALDPPAEPIFTWRHLFWAGLALALIWALGCLFELVRFTLGLLHVRRFLRTVEPVADPRLQRIARAAAQSVGLKHYPPLGQSLAIETPVSVGVLRGQVVLPARQLHEWSDDAWRALLLHEMAHLRRHDLLIGLVQRVALVLYWWNPLLGRVSSRIAVLREQICDDLVTQHGSQEARYAALIVELAGRVVTQRQLGPVLGAADGTPSELAQRIRRLLDPNRQLATHLSRPMQCAVAAFSVALILGVSTTSIRWAQAEESEAAPKNQQLDEVAKKALTALTDAKDTAPLEKKVRIVDLKGRPIVGATVTPWAIRSATGHGPWSAFGKGRSEPPVVTTDADGIATIRFPRYVEPEEKLPALQLTCRVEHPDFAVSTYNDVPVTPDELEKLTTIEVAPGAKVVVQPTAEGVKFERDRLFALWSSHTPNFAVHVTADDKLELPRLAPSDELMRVAYLPQQGPAMFSEVLTEKLENGQEYALTAALHPALRVQGQLDGSVPRPVKNGVVVGAVLNGSDGNRSLHWRVWTHIRDDGTFTLGPVPADQLQVIAICDGFMAASGSPPDFVDEQQRKLQESFNYPQVFAVSAENHAITLKMVPTTECTIRVLDPAGQPIQGAKCFSNPNVKWWDGGSQIYCHPLFSSVELLEGMQTSEIWRRMREPTSFEAVTDADGVAVVKNLPPREESFGIGHDNFEAPIDGNRRDVYVDLSAGGPHEVTVTMQPKGTQHIGDLPAALLEACAAPPAKIDKPAVPQTVESTAEPTELAGVVVDASGQPLPDVKVDAWTWHPGNETKTDKEGRFVLKGLERNEAVEIEFTKPDYSPTLFIEQMPGTSDWTVVLTQGTWLEGQVLDPQGMPVPNALIRAWRGPFRNPHVTISQVWTETHADEQGRYRLNLEPATYTIEVRIPGVGALRETNVSLAAKEKKSLDLKLDAGVTFEATVRDSITGQPVEGIVLWNWQHSDIKGKSDKEGKIVIEGMMPGEFKFQLSAIGSDRRQSAVAGEYARWWSPQAKNEWQRDETLKDKKVPPGFEGLKGKELDQLKRSLGIGQFQRNFDDLTFDLGGMSTQVEILVEPTVTIAGRVLDPDGNPVAGVTVAPAKTGSGNSLTGDTRFSYPTDKEGRFTMKLPAGKEIPYNLIAHDGKYQQWRNWANAAGENLLTKPGDKIDGVELRLTRGGIVKGRVLSAAGQPRAHVEVRAAAVDKRDNRYYVPTTRTDENGNYELRFISPGEQHIQVEPFWLQADQAPKGSTQVVTIKSDAVLEGIDFKTD